MTNANPTPTNVRVGCEFRLVSEIPTHAVFQVEPRRGQQAVLIREEWSIPGALKRRQYIDGYGNFCARMDMPAGGFTLRYDAVVEVPHRLDDADESAKELSPSELPSNVLVYLLPTRYCLSDVLADEAWRLFGAVAPGWARVQAICDYVNGSISYEAGSTGPLTTVVDVYEDRRGVCRDFAQLAISFCRALNIPARYAFGYLPDIEVVPDEVPMDFCAWMEVWLGGRWYTFDPRNNERRIGRVLIGHGRDALDCAMLTSYGNATLESMTVWADQVP